MDTRHLSILRPKITLNEWLDNNCRGLTTIRIVIPTKHVYRNNKYVIHI